MNNPLIYIDPEGHSLTGVIGGIFGGIWSGGSRIVSNVVNGKDWYEGVAGSTIEGAVTGFAIGTCGIKCAGIGNYIGNVSGQAVESWSTTGQIKINQKEAITHSVTTQVGAMVFGNPGMSYNYNIGEYISYYTLKGGITAASADMTYQFLDKGIIVDENNNIKGYDIESAINNYDITQTIRNGVIGAVTTPVIMGTSEFVVNKISSGNITMYDNSLSMSNISLNKVNPYNNQKTYLANYDKIFNQYKWGNPETFYDHFNRHGKGVNASSPEEYAIKARQFYENRSQYEVKLDSLGTVRVYDYNKKYLGSYNADTSTKTFFKTRSHQYWYNQPGEIIDRRIKK